MHRLGILIICWLVALGLSSQASAGVITKTDKAGDLKAAGLTAKERAALDIRSVTMGGESDLGVFVTVQFAGNFEKAIGRGHLVNGFVALVVQPASSSQEPSVLVTSGPGPLGDTAFKTASEDVGVDRAGSKLTFFIVGGGLENVRSIDVRVFAKRPAASARARAGGVGGGFDPFGLIPLIKNKPLEGATIVAKQIGEFASVMGCAGLDGLLREIQRMIAKGESLRPKANTMAKKQLLEQKLSALRKAEDAVGREIAERCSDLPPTELKATASWSFFGSSTTEAVLSFEFKAGFVGQSDGQRRRPADAYSPLDAVRVVLSSRQVTNFLCPSQLPVGVISTTTSTNDTLTCSGGTITPGQPLQLNVRMSPGPTTAMGGQLFGRQDGVYKGPFQISGP